MRIVISPFSKPMRNGKPHPKNYPYWNDITIALSNEGHEVIQIGTHSELRLKSVTDFKQGCKFKEIEELIRQSDLWISVENFLPHLCNAQKVLTRGIVIFSRSDPKIYGYFQNRNILKSREYLRPDQFHIWEQCEYVEEAFVKPDELLSVIHEELTKLKHKR